MTNEGETITQEQLAQAAAEGRVQMLDPQEIKVDRAIKAIIKVVEEHGLTEGEYLFVLKSFIAAALAAEKKSHENMFLSLLRKDILRRRLNNLKTCNAAGSA